MPILTAPISEQGLIVSIGIGVSKPRFEALIGRDVLSKGLLVYNGKAGSLSLAF